MGIRLDSPEEIITFPLIDPIPDGPENKHIPGPLLVCSSFISETGKCGFSFLHDLRFPTLDTAPTRPVTMVVLALLLSVQCKVLLHYNNVIE